MTVEGLGEKFRDARIAKGLSLDEAARMTKIRPSRLSEIEEDDYSNFPSLAYAKGFLQIYGKFLDIDVTPYLEAFETSGAITVDGYSYLQDTPAPKPTRTPVVRRENGNRTSLWPLVIGIVVLVVGWQLVRLMLNMQRLAPVQTTASATPMPSGNIVAPRAVPVDSAAPPPPATAAPTTAVAINPPPTAQPQPEVRRAEPVAPEELGQAPVPSGPAHRVEIKPVRKTYLKVTVDNEVVTPAFERWVSPADSPLEFSGHRFQVRVLDREAVRVAKDGIRVDATDADVKIEE